MRYSTRPENSERKDEKNHETTPIKRSSDQVGIFLENMSLVGSEIELNEEPRDHPAEDETSLILVERNEPSVLDELRDIDVSGFEASNFGDKLK